jgi:hypothetical protein
MSISACQWVASFVVYLGVVYFGLAYPLPAIAGQPQRTDVIEILSLDVVGTSQLVRTPDGVSMNLQTTGLEPGAAYTVWWVVFNNPGSCRDGCGEDDLGNSNVQATVLWATGHVIGDNGVGNFAAYLAEGDTSDVGPFGLPGDDMGLIDSTQAEIHLVVRTHGPPIPGRVKEQISTFEGGCDVNACEDQQFAVHQP